MAVDSVLQDLLKDAPDDSGVLDAFLKSIDDALKEQFQSKRITGPDYANVYLGSIQSAMSQAVAFVLGLRTANAQAGLLEAQEATEIQNALYIAAKTQTETDNQALIAAQIAKLTAETALIGKQELTEIQNTLLVTQKIATETANTSLTTNKAATELTQAALLTAQELGVDADTALTNAKTTTEGNISAREAATTTRINSEKLRIDQETILVTNQAATELAQELKVDKEAALLGEKFFTEQAQRLDTVNALPVVGVIGKQKDLYTAQVAGFDRDAEQKILKIMFDAWAVARSTDTAGAVTLPDEIGTTATFNSTLGTAITNAGI